MVEEIDIPVVIVGGGPVGLTLSNILGKNDVQHVLLEKNETTSKWPKAILTNTRSMELYRRLGLDSVLREAALPENFDIIGGRSLINEQPIINIPISQMTGKNPHKNTDGTITFDERWTTEYVCRMPQIFLEPVLKTVASKNISSQLNFGWQVQSISQTQENAIVEAVNVKSGERKVYRALYAVGCDGGKSFVRKSLGINFKGDFDLGRFNSVSFQSLELKKRLVTGDCFAAIIVKPEFLAFFFPLNTEGLFVAHYLPRDKELKPAELVRKLLDDEDIPFTIVFSNSWQGHFAHAETLQEGRVFLAGDSSHLMIPVGGFGMNTGILDAYDLGWKLVATLKGWGGERLLASYTAERLPSIKKVLRRISRLYYVLRNYEKLVVFLVSTRPFNYIMRMLINPSKLNPGVSGILFGTTLDSSPLCIPGGPHEQADPLLYYTPMAYPGCRAPHFQFEDGTFLYDKLGSVFTLLHLQPSTQNFDPLLAAAAHCGIPMKVLSFNDKKLKTLYRGMDLVLIRPDMYIAWCGNEIPTLLHKDDVYEGARVLMKVISGAASLPAEWQQSRKNRRNILASWWLPFTVSVLVGVSALSFTFLRQDKWIIFLKQMFTC